MNPHPGWLIHRLGAEPKGEDVAVRNLDRAEGKTPRAGKTAE